MVSKVEEKLQNYGGEILKIDKLRARKWWKMSHIETYLLGVQSNNRMA